MPKLLAQQPVVLVARLVELALVRLELDRVRGVCRRVRAAQLPLQVLELRAHAQQLLARAQANAEASQGKYKPGSQPSIEQSLYVKNYVRARHARTRACRQIHASEPTSRSLLRAGLLNASEGLR